MADRGQRSTFKLFYRLMRFGLRGVLTIGVASIALLVLIFWAAFQFVRPAPPDELTILTGAPDGAYQIFAARYKSTFDRNGIALKIEASSGAVENLQRILDPKVKADAAFIQGGVALDKDTTGLIGLGVLYPEPLWLFHRSDQALTGLEQVRGKRLAIGPEGSGTRLLAMELLRAHGIDGAPTQLSPLAGIEAAQALAQNELDAVFVVGAAQSGAVWTMFYTAGLELFDFKQAEAYARRFPYLSVLTLPRGAIDFQRDLPKSDITLVAPTASLVARESLHPALVDLLLQAATDVHSSAGLFQRAGEFPSPKGVEIPLSREAERYYRSGKPFLQRYMPFWAATLVDRLVIMLLPVLALLLPLSRIAPALYAWRIRARVFRYYGELKLLELEAQRAPESRTREQWLAEIDRIEQAAHRIRTPLAFAEHVYILRSHVHLVRKALLHRLAQAGK
jgi:TRAP transporter TAXI family solute receptor